MARLTKAELAQHSPEELKNLPPEQRPLTTRGTVPGKQTWSQMIRTAHRKAGIAEDIDKPRGRPASDIKTELGSLAPPKGTEDTTPDQWGKLQLNDAQLKRVRSAIALAKAFDITPETIANQINGMHQIGAIIMREPAIKLADEDEALAMGKAVYNVLIRYDMVWIFKHAPLFVLATTAASIEWNTVERVRAARAARARPRVVDAPASAPQQAAPQPQPAPRPMVVPTPHGANGTTREPYAAFAPLEADRPFAPGALPVAPPADLPFTSNRELPPQALPRQDTDETPQPDI